MRYPPVISLVNAVVRARTFAGAMDDAAGIVEKLRTADRGLRILGPAPAPLGGCAGVSRPVLVKGMNRRTAASAAILPRRAPRSSRRVVVDVDPLQCLNQMRSFSSD